MATVFNNSCISCDVYIKTKRLFFAIPSQEYGICDKCYYESQVNPSIIPPEPVTNKLITNYQSKVEA